MRIKVIRNKSPFTTASLKPIVKRFFVRTDVQGAVSVSFFKKTRGAVSVTRAQGTVVKAPFSDERGNVVVLQPKEVGFFLSRNADERSLALAVRWVGWQMRGASRFEANKRYAEPLSTLGQPANELEEAELYGGKLVLKPNVSLGRAAKGTAERLQAKLRRLELSHAKAKARAKASARAESRLAGKVARVSRQIERLAEAERMERTAEPLDSGKVEP